MKSRKLVLLTRLILTLIVSLTTGAMVALATNDVWEIHLPTNHSTDTDNTLHSVSAYSSSNVWAVGSYNTANGYLPLIEKWSGSSWAEQTSDSATYNNELEGVAALSSTDVWAVGYDGSGTKAGTWPWQAQPTTAGYTYAEHYNGSNWKRNTTTVSPGDGFNTFRSTCFISSTDGWAVGFYYNTGGAAYRTLAEHWDGTQWSVVSSPNPGTNNLLYGVACVATHDVWAVGNKDGNTLILHYSGSPASWSTVTSPNPGTLQNLLDGVTCYSSGECFTVGEYKNTGQTTYSSLTIRYDGTSWSTVSSPNQGTNDNVLSSVAYVGSKSWAWAVGFYDKPPYKTNILSWNGSSWSVATSPNQGTGNNRLRGVTTIPGSGICAGGGSWAAGAYINNSVYQTLAESYTITPSCRP